MGKGRRGKNGGEEDRERKKTGRLEERKREKGEEGKEKVKRGLS